MYVAMPLPILHLLWRCQGYHAFGDCTLTLRAGKGNTRYLFANMILRGTIYKRYEGAFRVGQNSIAILKGLRSVMIIQFPTRSYNNV